MTSLAAVIIILAISVCILLAIVVYNKATRWIAALIVPLLCIAAYLGWNSAESLKGWPTKNVYNDDALYLGSMAAPPKYIYVWVQPLATDEPILMSMPFTQQLAEKLAQANKDLCEGKPQGTRGAKLGENSSETDNTDGQLSGSKSIEIYEFNIKVAPAK